MRSHPTFRSNLQIVAIGEGLRDHTLPKEQWTHAAHFAAALWVLSHHSLDEALAHMPKMIRTYNEHLGNTNTDASGYHETITVASLRAADAVRRAHPDEELYELCNHLLRSHLGDPHWLLEYWSREVLFSVTARRTWVDPDLRALPFHRINAKTS